MKIYIAGSASHSCGYKIEFEKTVQHLKSLGCDVLNSVRSEEKGYKWRIDEEQKKLIQCDAIYMIRGYENSEDAKLELQYAKTIRLMIIYE